LKPILIQTTPHTGTHTCMYLYRYLGGIPTFFMHFGDWDMSEFLSEFHDFRERFTFVHTARPYQDTVATYKKRTPKYAHDPEHSNSAENLVKRNMVVEEKWHREFSEALIQPIGIDVSLQAACAKLIFEACGYEVPAIAKRFLETWPPKGTFPTGAKVDFHGFDTEAEATQMNRFMNDCRIMPSNEWKEKVNLALKELSN